MSQGTSLAIRALGPYGGSAPGFRLTTFLIDGESALDAGALTDALPLSAQRRVRRVFLTHAHFDHIASLPLLMENLYGQATPLEVPLTDGRRALALPCGNGEFAAYWAVDATDKPVCLVVDFDVLTHKDWKSKAT